MQNRRRTLLVAAAGAAGLYLTVGLAWLVAWPDDEPLLGAVRAAALVVGWLGVYGVVRERSALVEVSALGLALLGFWQPVAWVVVLPTGAVLAGAAAALARWGRDGDDEAGAGGDGEAGGDGDDEAGAGRDDGDGDSEVDPGAGADGDEDAE